MSGYSKNMYKDDREEPVTRQLPNAEWLCHTPNLLKEILNNPGTEILRIPLQIFGLMLAEVAERAIELDDPELNRMMCKLTLYSVADPLLEDHNQSVLDEVEQLAKEAKDARK